MSEEKKEKEEKKKKKENNRLFWLWLLDFSITYSRG
jgi:hypothetical protein